MSLTIGEQCLKFMEDEMKANVTCDPRLPATPRVKEYFSILTRNINGKEVNLNLTQGNWCAAAVSFSMFKTMNGPNDIHGYRAGCIEIQNDLIKSKSWYNKEYIKEGIANLMLGDIVITDRSNPSNPDSAWWRHILRVYSVNGDSFECISGNSVGGKYRVSKHTLSDKNLIGFGLIDEREIKTLGIINVPIKVEEKDMNPEIDNFYDLYSQLF